MVTMSGIEGCSPVQRKHKVKIELENKYNEEFEIVAYRAPGILGDTYTVTAYAVEYPDLPFVAYMDVKTGDVTSSYVSVRLCDRMSQKMMMNLKDLSCQCYVFTKTNWPETLSTDTDITLEDYLKENPGNRFSIYLYLDKADAEKENVISSAAKMMEGISGIEGSVSIYLTDSETLSKVQEYVSAHAYTDTAFDELAESDYLGSVKLSEDTDMMTEMNIQSVVGGHL